MAQKDGDGPRQVLDLGLLLEEEHLDPFAGAVLKATGGGEAARARAHDGDPGGGHGSPAASISPTLGFCAIFSLNSEEIACPGRPSAREIAPEATAIRRLASSVSRW
jgi:hypothetical protein